MAAPFARTLLSLVDPSADPCVDFYAYACGGWDHEASPQAPDTTRGFAAATERTDAVVRQVLVEAGLREGDPLGLLWRGCNDTSSLEALQGPAMALRLAAVADVRDVPSMMRFAADLQMIGGEAFFHPRVNSRYELTVLELRPGGNPTPGRSRRSPGSTPGTRWTRTRSCSRRACFSPRCSIPSPRRPPGTAPSGARWDTSSRTRSPTSCTSWPRRPGRTTCSIPKRSRTDLGGVELAWSAWQTHAGEPRRRAVRGLTNDQVFFVAMAQNWCSETTPEVATFHAERDPHSLPRIRVNGALQNLPAFAATFQCDPGTPMTPPDTCAVWGVPR